MRSRTEVYLRNCASAAGSRDRSSRRKYSDTNRSSPVKPAAPAGLGAPACIDSAARYKPAGQPSVRSVSSESSLASSSTPAASSSNSASCSSSRRSATPISCTDPCARQRASGSARLLPARDRDLRAGRDVLEQLPRARPDRTGWRPRADRRAPARAGARAQPVRSRHAGRVSTKWIPLGPTTRRTPRAGPARRGESRPRCSAGTRQRRRLAPSSATHANGRGSASAHRARSVVLPYPAGATTLTNGTVDAQSRAITSAFATVPARASGAASLTSTRSKGTADTAIGRADYGVLPVGKASLHAVFHPVGMRQAQTGRAHTLGRNLIPFSSFAPSPTTRSDT